MSMHPEDEKYWLPGNPQWWPNSVENHNTLRFNEEMPPASWHSTTSDLGGKGWIRQRLEPVAPRILFPTAWSLFFLIASSTPLLFPDKTPIDDQNLAASFFVISWFLLLMPFFWYSNANNENFSFFPLEIISFILGLLLFLLHIAIDPRIGWFSYLLFIYSWISTVRNISDSLSINSARWLLPISKSDFPTEIFNDGWFLLSKKFRNGLIATWSKELGPYSGEITGLTRSYGNFLAFSLVYKNRIIHDPFTLNSDNNNLLKDVLEQPPLKILGESWPVNLIQIRDEE